MVPAEESRTRRIRVWRGTFRVVRVPHRSVRVFWVRDLWVDRQAGNYEPVKACVFERSNVIGDRDRWKFEAKTRMTQHKSRSQSE